MNSVIKSPKEFTSHIAELVFINAFNPYRDICPIHDRPAAVEIRRSNLTRVIEAALQQPKLGLWIGRDLGYRGGRRTGLALTDEANLENHAAMLGLKGLSPSTRGPIVAERTAAIIWRMIAKIKHPIFLWNVFPLHPHLPDQPMSNRSHTGREAEQCRFLLDWLLESLRPTEVVAIGRDAQLALQRLHIPAVGVRHPSYGGQTEFTEAVSKIYKIEDAVKVSQSTQLRLI